MKQVRGFYKKTAQVVGIVYLVGMVVGIVGNIMILKIFSSPDHLSLVATNSTVIGIAALLWLIAVLGDTAHGVLMYPVLKPFGGRLALGYLSARILDSAFVAIMVLLVLIQIPLSNEYLKTNPSDPSFFQALSAMFMQAQLYAYHFGMTTVGVAGLMLCYVFYKAQLLSRFLSLWGLVGYAVILVGSLMEIAGIKLMDMHAVPGGLWEIFIGVWLIVKGFKIPTLAVYSTKNND